MSEASVLNKEELAPLPDRAGGMVRDLDWLLEPIWRCCANGITWRHSSLLRVSAPRGKASRLQGLWVIDQKAGTHARSPMRSTSANPSESDDGRA